MEEHVCPHSHAGFLDNWLRRLVHNPRRIFGSYVGRGDRVLDVGCASGTFTFALADMVGDGGSVIACDIQEEMLDKLRKKIEEKGVGSVVEARRCSEDGLGVSGPFDFVLAFYVVHEVPDPKMFYQEVHTILGAGGLLMVVEPNSRVTSREFGESISLAEEQGLTPSADPKVLFSRAMLLRKP
ncbi:MAG: methyltransferase domain-containing protein [Candidatus Altiarchaeales archaeon]|nr:methyltransferase domain-containing protein [Candidatus Altiarchaeales archaeon]MBD3415546.1 methyltransferase domain-containing protein [Candidatus Altiarchaeales archaeon]